MDNRTVTALAGKLGAYVGLGKYRLETLCLLIVGVISARTVNLSHLACERGGRVLIASTYRRLQRFFQHVSLPQDWAAMLVARLAGVETGWTLCLDRTNWAVGRSQINILVLALATRRHRLPLMWTQLGRRGNSGTPDRIALMQRFIATFGKARVGLLLADREFVSEDWFNWLIKNDIPFTIRLRQDLIARDGRGHDRPLLQRFRRRGTGKTQKLTFFASAKSAGLTLLVSAKRLKPTKRRANDLLIVATNRADIYALTAYRKRWAVECLFADTKTRGFNIEDTRLTNPKKLDLLIAVIALAAAWASRTAALVTRRNALPRKSHGYYAKSFFRTGFDAIRNLIRSQNPDAITQTLAAWQNIPKLNRVV